jgi:hypothetical protein
MSAPGTDGAALPHPVVRNRREGGSPRFQRQPINPCQPGDLSELISEPQVYAELRHFRGVIFAPREPRAIWLLLA